MDCYNNMPQSELRIVRGNDFTTLYQLTAKYADGTIVEDFDIRECTDVKVLARRRRVGSESTKDISAYGSYTLSTNNTLRLNWDGLLMKVGTYTVDFAAKYDGVDIRCYSTTELVFDIVETNEEANIPAGTLIDDGTYMIDGDFVLLFGVQERADWEQTDPNEPSYIKNKPDLNVYVEKEEGKGLSENDYTDEDKQKVADAVPNTREINGKALDSDITLTSSDIGALPTSTKYGYSIDLTLNSQDYKLTATLKDQDGTILNSKMVDLPLETVVVSGRYDSTNRAIVLTLQNGNSIDVPVGDLVNGLQSQITSSNKLSADLVDDTNAVNKFVSASEKTAWDAKQDELESGVNIKTINNQSLLGSGNIDIQGGGGGGAIDSISVNGVPQMIDEDNNVDITVPTKVSDLSNDSGFITTETDPTVPSWAKQSTKPTYTAQEVGALPSSTVIPDELKDLSDDSTHRLVTDTEKSTWNGKYSKPNDGIPSTDLANGVIPDVSNFITKSVNDLANYYTKTQTYTQAEVDALLGAINQFHYEIAESTSAVVSPASNVLYLIGPTGSGTDKYEEYVYTTTWVKIGDTSIDLSGYVTTTALNTALADYTATTDLNTLLAGYQTKIDSTHKLDYSLLSNTPTIPDAQIQSDWNQTTTTAKDYIKNKPTIPAAQVNSDWNASSGVAQILNKPTIPTALSQLSDDATHRLVTDTEISTWNGKQDALASGTNVKTINGSSILGSGNLSTFTPVVNHGTSDTTFAVIPNILHIWGEVASLTLTLATPADNTIVNLYMFVFISGSTPTTLSLPQYIVWGKAGALIPEANTLYEVTIRDDYATWDAYSLGGGN